MTNRSSNPAVVTKTVRAPLRSRIAFVATVVPCAMPTAPSSCIPWTTARDGSRVDGTFAVTTSRPRNPTKSVNVPPTSTPTSIAGRIARDHKRLRAIRGGSPLAVRPSVRRSSWRSVTVASQCPREILRVPFDVRQAVATVVEGDDRLLVLLLRLQGEVDRTADRVARLRRRDQAFRFREDLPGLECAQLVDGPRLDEACIEEDAQRRRGPVVSQSARMDARRHKRVAQRVHLHEGRHLPCVAEVVFVPTLR